MEAGRRLVSYSGTPKPHWRSPQLLAQFIPGARVELLPGDHFTVLADPGFVPAIVGYLASVSPVGV